MTEKEFFQQVWRPYDLITLEGGITGNIINVCFPTRSVCVSIAGAREWFRCELITEHTPRTGNPDDISTIADLQEKLMAANQKTENQKKTIAVLQDTIKQLKEKLQYNSHEQADRIETLLKAIRESLIEKQKRVEKNLESIAELDMIIDNFYKTNK
jgi:predicted transcriptional regulator